MTGTLLGVTSLVDAGGALLVVALVLLLRGVRGGRGSEIGRCAFRLLAVVPC